MFKNPADKFKIAADKFTMAADKFKKAADKLCLKYRRTTKISENWMIPSINILVWGWNYFRKNFFVTSRGRDLCF